MSSLPAATRPTSSVPWPLPPGVKTLRVNGYDMAHVERGTGTPILMVHGSTGDYRAFEMQMEPLGQRYRAIAVSLRHYYPEPWDGSGEFSSRQQMADVIAFIEALGAGRVHLIGHSRGGYVSAHVARMRPDLLRTLTLMEPGLPPAALLPGMPDGARLAERRRDRTRQTMELVRDGKIEGAVEFFVDGISGTGTYKSRADAANQITRDNIRTVLGESRDTREPLSREQAAKIAIPTLLVGGETSRPDFALLLRALEECLPNAKRVTIANTGHTMQRGNADAFNAAVLAFIAPY